MTQHFSLAEFTASARATALGIDNTLPLDLMPNATRTMEMLERIRSTLGAPVLLTSGYRCLELNRAVGGANGSDHVLALAADWTSPMFGSPLDACRLLAPLARMLGIGQLIYECPKRDRQWVHTSAGKSPGNILTIGPGGTTRAGILEVWT